MGFLDVCQPEREQAKHPIVPPVGPQHAPCSQIRSNSEPNRGRGKLEGGPIPSLEALVAGASLYLLYGHGTSGAI